MYHCYMQLLQIMILTISMSHSQLISADKVNGDLNQSQSVWQYMKEVVSKADEQIEKWQETLKPQTIQLTTVGDIMMHEPQITSGYDPRTKTYAYDDMFKEVAPYLKASDLTIGNLELTLAGENKKYTGYPRFNAPDELADALKAAGFDVLTTANNHSLDRDFEGLKRTIDVLQQRGIQSTGTYQTKESSEAILIQEVKGSKIAFLAYTYGTNGIKVSKGKEYSINYINKEKIAEDIEKARALKAELVCVSMHFGVEYARVPNKAQQEMVDFLVENGVDLILGSHPHVLQPMEIREAQVNGKSKEVVILYSQGNFISAQRDRYKETGSIFNIILNKAPITGELSVKEVTYIPTWVDASKVKGKYHYRILPTKRAVHLYENGMDPLISRLDYERLKTTLKDVRAMFQDEDERIVEQQTFIN